MKKDKPFKGLAGILDIIYGALVSFVIYTIGEKYFSLPEGSSFISIKLLALILVGIFMLEDYCNVKLVNSVKEYGSTDRFSLDVMIALLFFLAFQAVNKERTSFIYFIGLTHLMRTIWASFILNRNMMGEEYTKYLKLISWTNFILSLVCLILIILNKIPTVKMSYQLMLQGYMGSYFVILFLFVVIIKFKDIAKEWLSGEKEVDSFRKEIGPILSKFAVYILLLLVLIIKALVKVILSILKGRRPIL